MVPRALVRWALTFLVIVALGLATLALIQAGERDQEICDLARQNREAAIIDIREQARILVSAAVRNAEQDGRIADARRIRALTGPPFIAEQEREAIRRHPPIRCDRL